MGTPREKHIGTFGSFIGYSAAFPLLIKTQFPEVTIGIAFLGPLVVPSSSEPNLRSVGLANVVPTL